MTLRSISEWSLTTEGLLKKYKNLETFFDKTQRDALAYRELVAKYNQPRVDGEPPKDRLS